MANGQIIAEQDAFRVSFALFPQNYCLKRAEQDDHRVAWRQISGTTIQVVQTTSLHKQIISTHLDNKLAWANLIDPFGQQVRTSKSDWPVLTTSFLKRIRSTLSDNKSVQANQIEPSGQQVCTSKSDQTFRTTSPYNPIRSLQIARTVIEPLIVVTFLEFRENRTVIRPLYTVTIFEVREDQKLLDR